MHVDDSVTPRWSNVQVDAGNCMRDSVCLSLSFCPSHFLCLTASAPVSLSLYSLDLHRILGFPGSLKRDLAQGKKKDREQKGRTLDREERWFSSGHRFRTDFCPQSSRLQLAPPSPLAAPFFQCCVLPHEVQSCGFYRPWVSRRRRVVLRTVSAAVVLVEKVIAKRKGERGERGQGNTTLVPDTYFRDQAPPAIVLRQCLHCQMPTAPFLTVC